MKHSIQIFLYFSIIISGTLGCKTHPESIIPIVPEEYLVYSSIVNDLSSSNEHRLAFISDSTMPVMPPIETKYSGSKKIMVYHDYGIGKYAPRISESINQIWPEFNVKYFQGIFKNINSRSYKLILDSIHTVIPIMRYSRDSISSKMIWNGEALQIWFSRVVFNHENSEAVIYLDYVCGSLCGEGRWCWLKKSNGSWKVFKSFHTWVS